jgi:hypothetical protein
LLTGQTEHRCGNVALDAGHVRAGDRRMMRQAYEVEATQP